MFQDFRYSDTERLSRSDEVLKLKNFKKDATLKLSKSTNQEWYEHVGPEVTRSQDDKLDAEWCFAWLMNINRLAYALSMSPLLLLPLSIACDDGCSYCRFDVGLHEAMMSLGVGKLKDKVICTLAWQLLEVAAMAYVLRFATLLSLYIGILSLPAQSMSSRLWQWDQTVVAAMDGVSYGSHTSGSEPHKLHEAMMSLGVGKLKDEVICTLARQLTEVAAMAYVLQLATLQSLYSQLAANILLWVLKNEENHLRSHFEISILPVAMCIANVLVFFSEAQSQEKDMIIKKLKERIKSLSGKINEDKIKKDLEEIETINIELDHMVSKLIAKNEHLKQTYKQLDDSIKPTCIRSKEQCEGLINQVNLKFVEISDLNARLQEQVSVISVLKDDLRKVKGKALVDNAVTKHTIDPEMLKIDVDYLNHRLLNNRSAHSDYLKHTQEDAGILREIVKLGKSQNPLNESLDSACKYTKKIQELLIIVRQTCPSINNTDKKLVAVTPKNKDKKVRFTEPVTSSGNKNTNTSPSSNLVSNKPMLSSTRVKSSTSASGSQPSGNTKKDKIQQTPSRTQKNKVEAHPRKVKSSLKNKDSVVAPKGTANVQHSKLNANSEPKCVKCNGCMVSDNHDLCVLDFINNVNARVKSKSVKKSSKRKVWKPTGKVITITTEVPLRKPTTLENETPKHVVTLVYSRKPRKSKTNVPVSKSKVIQIVLWYLDSGCSKHMTRDRSQLTNFVHKFLGTVKFRNDHMPKILGYGDYQIGNVTISRVYYVEGLGHDLFSIGQFCDSNFEVAFRQHTCFIRNLEGVNLLTGS
ncbi:hypothetical protein Tco_0990474 [Tanacetum coccineum]|uniref:Retrovirus-related Pol polyprotein from transposon TNT 1-94-like beta-barrel domain-containing protein n=1 Tax=Tanacetum coccineum TaxID=301880 RepID=A0ABQ5EWV6_9ASTR